PQLRQSCPQEVTLFSPLPQGEGPGERATAFTPFPKGSRAFFLSPEVALSSSHPLFQRGDLPPDFGPHVMWEIKVITPLVVRTRQAEHSQVNCAVGSRCNVLSIA